MEKSQSPPTTGNAFALGVLGMRERFPFGTSIAGGTRGHSAFGGGGGARASITAVAARTSAGGAFGGQVPATADAANC